MKFQVDLGGGRSQHLLLWCSDMASNSASQKPNCSYQMREGSAGRPPGSAFRQITLGDSGHEMESDRHEDAALFRLLGASQTWMKRSLRGSSRGHQIKTPVCNPDYAEVTPAAASSVARGEEMVLRLSAGLGPVPGKEKIFPVYQEIWRQEEQPLLQLFLAPSSLFSLSRLTFC